MSLLKRRVKESKNICDDSNKNKIRSFKNDIFCIEYKLLKFKIFILYNLRL